MSPPHVLLFDLDRGGHHGQYIRQLVEYWEREKLDCTLGVAVGDRFLDTHRDVAELLQRSETGLRHHPIDDSVDLRDESAMALVRRDILHGRVLQQVLRDVRPDHCVLMYFDHAQLSLAFNLRFDFDVKISGIYFRPSFHYGELGTPSKGMKERLGRLRKLATLKGALRNRHFETLFCLDPFVVPYVRRMAPDINSVVLPDGVEIEDPTQQASNVRFEWGVEGNRRVALMFGVLDSRKGLFAVLDGCQLLTPTAQAKLSIVLAGKVSEAERARAYREIDAVRRDSRVQILLEDRFLPNDRVQDYIRAADFTLLTYVRHVGSSNVLIRAAAAQRPVLGSDFGLVAAHIREQALGLAVDTTSPADVAEGLRTFIEEPDRIPFDANSALRFASENSATRFAEAIFRHLGVLSK